MANTLNRTLADIFKTPGKLRGKTPRTVRKAVIGDMRAVSLTYFIPHVPFTHGSTKPG